MRNRIDIDPKHSRAIVQEIGERLRVCLKEESELPGSLSAQIDRRRELGLLRFLGAASGQIHKLIVIEAGLIGLLANFAGVALGFALSLILIYVINKQSFGWTIRFHWPVAVLLGALTLVYAATVLAGLYPARVAVRLNPVEVVHEE